LKRRAEWPLMEMMMREGLDGAARRAIFPALVLATLLGVAWLVGVRKHDAMLEAAHARAAFAAVKAAAGPRMQVRKIQISKGEMSVLAYDPDMPEWRYVGGTRGHPGHWYNAFGIYEQSWQVSYWTVFGFDWYRVTGPTAEGIIQRKEGPAFDLRPENFIDVDELLRRATPDPATPKDACPLRLIDEARVWWICEHHGDPLLVFLRAVVPSAPTTICDPPARHFPDADHPLESLVPHCHPSQ
jgi:hypothetical protein